MFIIQVLKLEMKDGNVNYIEEVYAENNRAVHCSSAASHFRGGLLIGTVMDKLLYCKVQSE